MNRFAAAAIHLLVFATGALAAGVIARVDTNGTLKGYVVQKDGETICTDPTVRKTFRGPTSYILCD